jgi:hypothetical protein
MTQTMLFDTRTETIAPAPIEPQPAPVVVLDADYYRAHMGAYSWRCWEAGKDGKLPTEAVLRDWFRGLYGYGPDAVIVLPDIPRIAWVGPVRGRG